MKLALFLLPISLTLGLTRADNLPACTASGFAGFEQFDCLVSSLGGETVITPSLLNDPTFVNTPVNQAINEYQTTITAVLNGGTSVYQQTFSAPFNALAVQNAVTAADALLTGDGATFGAPFQTTNSTALLSSTTSYVPTSPTLDLPTLFACNPTLVNYTGTCNGVSVTFAEDLSSAVDTFGPATIMTGAGNTDQYAIPGGQEDINVNYDYTYTVTQNALTTNTYLTTQSYQIDGTTSQSTAPEPGTWGLVLGSLLLLALQRPSHTKDTKTLCC
jgi:hypothetical protein